MFGKKKAPKQAAPESDQPKTRKGNALMAQLGLGNDMGQLEDMIYGEDDDDDLEAELAALQGTTSPEHRPVKPKSKPLDMAAINNLLNQDDDADDDDDLSEGEESGLMAELDELETPSAGSSSNSCVVDMATTIEDRLAMYEIGVENAKKVGDSGKERRLDRGLKTLQDLLKRSKAGEQIQADTLPPPITMGSASASGTTQQPPPMTEKPRPPQTTLQPTSSGTISKSPTNQRVSPIPPISHVPSKPIPAVPSSKPQITLHKTHSSDPGYVPGSEFVEDKDKETHAMLFRRRAQYKQAALMAKKAGNIALATEHVRTAKQFDSVILALEEGKPIDLSKMPPPPSSNDQPPLQSLEVVAETKVRADAQNPKPEPSTSAGPEQEPSVDPQALKEFFNAPDAKMTMVEALNDRYLKYKSAEEDAKKEGNSSKIRRMGRIAKQYEEAIKAHKAGRPVDYDSLPCPPGFPPLPLAEPFRAATLPAPVKPDLKVASTDAVPSSTPQPAVQQQLQKSAQPAAATSMPGNQPHPSTSSQKQGAPKIPAAAAQTLPAKLNPQKQQVGGKKSISMRQEQQIAFLRGRMQEFKEEAVKAKKNNDIELAKKYYRFVKGCEPMLEAATAGLPIDLTQVPEPPPTSSEEKFVILSEEECEISGDRDEMYKKLTESLTQQIKMSATNAEYYKKLGDIPMAAKFTKYEQNSRKDLESLKSGLKHGDPVPKFHYEARTFSLVRCNADLGDNDMELCIVRGIQYNPPSGYKADDLSTYIKYELPFPAEEPQKGCTESVRGSDPLYKESFKLTINKKSRVFMRLIERKGIKMEVYYKRGLLKGDKLLGNVNIPLQPLENLCTLHESCDLTEANKPVGGKLEVKLRVRDGLKTRQVDEVREKWLVIDSFVRRPEPSTAVAADSSPKKPKSDEISSIEVMKFEKHQLDRQISFLKESLSASQTQALVHRSQLIQTKIEQKQKSLKDGGLPALKAYAAELARQVQPYDDEAKTLVNQGDMQKAQVILSKKKEILKELNALNTRLKVMT